MPIKKGFHSSSPARRSFRTSTASFVQRGARAARNSSAERNRPSPSRAAPSIVQRRMSSVVTQLPPLSHPHVIPLLRECNPGGAAQRTGSLRSARQEALLRVERRTRAARVVVPCKLEKERVQRLLLVT